ncbi:MAG TPA: LpqB family beta-propeller domain-containing protein [Myxococcus sp.]|nr:LpqB family beta-propeller domain-containing protein [Myxococcus sp.]
MSALPAALRPWAAQLSLFPADVALHLGPYVARLSAALGTLRPRGEAEGGEPQGYDGLTRRGPFDRLLVSEWLWALELPDELVRRAAFGELSFLKPAFRQPQGARRSVALLDAGPDQLGAPRIAHLALLLVLARRAEAAGAAFAWGVLQEDPAHGVQSTVTPGVLQSWLALRTTQPPTAERLEAWRAALALDAAPEDAWLVGGPRLSRLPGAQGLSRVEVSEVLAPDARRLSVEVRPASGPSRSVVLELPPTADCVRLLRDPFEVRAATPVVLPRTSRVQRFAFSADGARLMLFHEDGAVAAMALPHSPRATVPKPRRVMVPEGQRVVAAGWRYHGGLLVLSQRGGAFFLHGKLRQSSARRGPASGLFSFMDKDLPPPPVPQGAQPGLLLSFADASGNERVLLSGVDSGLYLVEEDRSVRRVNVSMVARLVRGAAEVNRKPVFHTSDRTAVDAEPGDTGWLGVVERDCVRHMPLGTGHGRAFFGYSAGGGHPDAGLLAVRDPPDWRIFLAGSTLELHVDREETVVGVVAAGGAILFSEPGLLVLDADRRTFWHVTTSGRRMVTKAGADVVHAEASHAVPVLGWLTAAGELVLWHLRDGHVLYRAAPEGGG